jgi:hypothetical protein
MSTPLPWRRVTGGLELFLRVTPNAGVTRIDGIEIRDDGSAMLRVRVTAVPDKGKANKAVIALIADRFAVAKSSVTLKSGESARLKLLHLAGDPADLAAKARNLFQSDA